MIKSVALDLDGTLLNSKKEISDKNIFILRELYKKGIEVFIVTGRSYSATKEILRKLELPIITICYNGAKAIDTKDESILLEEPLSEDIVKILIELSRENSIHLNLYQDENWFVEDRKNWQTEYYKKNIGIDAIEKNFNDFTSLLMTKALFIDERCNLEKIEKEIKKKLGDRVHLTYSQERYLEVLNKKVNKGKSLEKILRLKSLTLDTCIAFGDANNDKEMIEMVGYGVAMENGEEYLKKGAKYLTDSNDNDGVYKFLVQKM
ncbi:MAG: Cof-type HAD-IIB family hydrolase [Cetobacterium sp.]|uniref:Cof-type HAD-IIB family hydrolase n=1 Tax=Cetobacterium sp. TaxID=2071632 RepID=UPI003F3679E1